MRATALRTPVGPSLDLLLGGESLADAVGEEDRRKQMRSTQTIAQLAHPLLAVTAGAFLLCSVVFSCLKGSEPMSTGSADKSEESREVLAQELLDKAALQLSECEQVQKSDCGRAHVLATEALDNLSLLVERFPETSTARSVTEGGTTFQGYSYSAWRSNILPRLERLAEAEKSIVKTALLVAMSLPPGEDRLLATLPVLGACKALGDAKCVDSYAAKAVESVSSIRDDAQRSGALAAIVAVLADAGLFASARALLSQMSDAKGVAYAKRRIAQSMAYAGDLDSATELLSEISDPQQNAIASLALVAALGRSSAAMPELEHLLCSVFSKTQEVPDALDRCELLAGLAETMAETGSAERARALAGQIPCLHFKRVATIRTAKVLRRRGGDDVETSAKALVRAVYETPENSEPHTMEIWRELGTHACIEGAGENPIDLLRKALDLSKTAEPSPESTQAAIAVGSRLHALGKEEVAHTALQIATDMAGAIPDESLRASTLGTIATAWGEMGQPSKGIEAIDHLSFFGRNHIVVKLVRSAIASGNMDLAMRTAEGILDDMAMDREAGAQYYSAAKAFSAVACAMAKQGDPVQATAVAHRAFETSSQIPYTMVRASVLGYMIATCEDSRVAEILGKRLRGVEEPMLRAELLLRGLAETMEYRTHHGGAVAEVREALQWLKESSGSAYEKDTLLAVAVAILAQAEELKLGIDVLGRIKDHGERHSAIMSLVPLLARQKLADRATSLASSISGNLKYYWRADVLFALADSLYDMSEYGGAVQAFGAGLKATKRIADKSLRQYGCYQGAKTAIHLGLFEAGLKLEECSKLFAGAVRQHASAGLALVGRTEEAKQLLSGMEGDTLGTLLLGIVNKLVSLRRFDEALDYLKMARDPRTIVLGAIVIAHGARLAGQPTVSDDMLTDVEGAIGKLPSPAEMSAAYVALADSKAAALLPRYWEAPSATIDEGMWQSEGVVELAFAISERGSADELHELLQRTENERIRNKIIEEGIVGSSTDELFRKLLAGAQLISSSRDRCMVLASAARRLGAKGDAVRVRKLLSQTRECLPHGSPASEDFSLILDLGIANQFVATEKSRQDLGRTYLVDALRLAGEEPDAVTMAERLARTARAYHEVGLAVDAEAGDCLRAIAHAYLPKQKL